MKDIIVLYHKNCPDGFGAAWAAWKKFGNYADYIGVEHGKPAPKNLKNKEIYILDFSYPIGIMKNIFKSAKKLTVIDHHFSAKESVAISHDRLYKLNHSGAVLSWKYFHAKKKIPKLLLYIEDADIWKWKVPKTEEIMSYLGSCEFNFKLWDKISKLMDSPENRKKILNDGGIILKYKNALIKKLIDQAEAVDFGGHKIFCVNSSAKDLVSSLGNMLAVKKPPFSIVWFVKKGTIIVSLRSINKFDVSKIAQKYGGGGHKAAAGFSFDSKIKFPWKPIK